MMQRFADFFIAHRPVVAGATIALTLIAVWGNVTDRPPWEIAESDETRLLDEVAEDFDSRGIDCFVVIEAADFFDPTAVAGVRAAVSAIEALDYVESAFWLDNVQSLNAFGLANPVLPPAGSTRERFRQARQRALEHPLIRGQLLAEDARTMLVLVSFDWSYVTSDEDCTRRLVDAARAAADNAGGGLKIRLTGRVPIYVEQKQSFDASNLRFQIIGYSLNLILASIIFRGASAVLIVAAAPAIGIFWSNGILGLIGEPENPLAGPIMPVLIAMVGLTDGVHLMTHIRRKRQEGSSSVDAVHSSIVEVGLACGLTSFTTAVGFGSLMLAQSEFVQGFGRSCAIAVLITFVAVITFIPLACLTPLARRIHVGQEGDLIERLLYRFPGIIETVLLRRRSFVVIGVVATVALSAVAAALRPNASTRNRLPTRSETVQALAHCDRVFGGLEMLELVVQWPEGADRDRARILGVIRAVEAAVDTEQLLRYPMSIRNVVDSIPGQTDDASRMSLLELVPESVTRQMYQPARRRALMNVRVEDIGIAMYEPVFRRLRQRLDQIEQEFPGYQVHMTGNPVVRGRSLAEMVTDLVRSLGAASLIILVTIALVYRSVRFGLITVIPNMFPLVATGALLVAMGKFLDLSAVCAFTVCLGIAVDDTIHFMSRFQFERPGRAVAEAVRRTYFCVGTPMVTTTVIMVAGFATVLASDLPMQRTFASMACMTLGAALVGDLVFLPAMLASFVPRSADSAPSLPPSGRSV